MRYLNKADERDALTARMADASSISCRYRLRAYESAFRTYTLRGTHVGDTLCAHAMCACTHVQYARVRACLLGY